MRRPFFSIVIPTYNRAEDLRFAIYCILRQNFKDFGIIVSDNCSTDDTKQMVYSFRDKRIKYFRNRQNIGPTQNVRSAIKHAKGKYIFIHGDDDFLLYEETLSVAYRKIREYDVGFIRLNYAVRTPDKKKIFHYHGQWPFTSDHYLLALADNKDVLSFIMDVDSGFMTGLIFKNRLIKNVTIINSDFLSWAAILFYVSKKWGAYFVSKPYTIASWSVWRPNRRGLHIMFSLTDGKLATENFLHFVRGKLNKNSYKNFLRNHLWLIYATMLPAIKFYVGEKNMLKLVNRLRDLDKDLEKNIFFWAYFISALVSPKLLLKFGRNIAFYIYSKFSKVANSKKILAEIKTLEGKYAENNK